MLSIIIVNYNSVELIRQALESLNKFHPNNTFEIIIINNYVDENKIGIENLKSKFINLKWCDMNYNAGFSRANNAGIKMATFENLLLLNPDTIFIEPILNECLFRFNNMPNSSAFGVQLLYEDLSFQISGSYFVKGGVNSLLAIPVFGNLIKKIGTLFKQKIPNILKAEKLESVDWLNGAFIMTKKSVIDKVGLLDEDFFMYFEEIEWCSRLKKTGNLYICGDLKLIHLLGKTSKNEMAKNENQYHDLYSKKGLQLIISNFLRIRKQYGVFWFLFIYSFFFLSSIVLPFLKFIKDIFSFSKINISKEILFLKNMFRTLKYLLIIFFNKPYFYKVI